MSQVIISLKPRYAKLVLSGNKTVELRKQKSSTEAWDAYLAICDTTHGLHRGSCRS